MFSQMTVPGTAEAYISPYGIFDRLADWASDPFKSPEKRRAEFDSAHDTIDRIEKDLNASKPVNPRAEEKLRISRQELAKARSHLDEAEDMLTRPMRPFPAR